MPFNDIYRLRILQRLHNQQVINVLHFKEDTPVGGSGAQALADDFRTNMDVTLRARATSEMTFEAIEVVPLVPIDAAGGMSAWPANTVGTRASSCPTGSVCEVITVYTGQPGRRHRGRMYLAGIAGADMLAGSVVAGQTTRTSAFATALLNRYARVPYTTSWALGVWSRLLAGAFPPYNTDAFSPCTSLTVRTILRNQRRRQLGVGR